MPVEDVEREMTVDEIEQALKKLLKGERVSCRFRERRDADGTTHHARTWRGKIEEEWDEELRSVVVLWDKRQPGLTGRRRCPLPEADLPDPEWEYTRISREPVEGRPMGDDHQATPEASQNLAEAAVRPDRGRNDETGGSPVARIERVPMPEREGEPPPAYDFAARDLGIEPLDESDGDTEQSEDDNVDDDDVDDELIDAALMDENICPRRLCDAGSRRRARSSGTNQGGSHHAVGRSETDQRGCQRRDGVDDAPKPCKGAEGPERNLGRSCALEDRRIANGESSPPKIMWRSVVHEPSFMLKL